MIFIFYIQSVEAEISLDDPNIDKAFILSDLSSLKKEERNHIVQAVFIQIKGSHLTTNKLREMIAIESLSKGN